MRSLAFTIAIAGASALTAASPALASDKLLIAPVQGNEIVDAELVVELEEAVRAGAMKRARDLDIKVMSHAALARSLDDLRKGRRDAIGLPCKDAQCDAGLGRALRSQLVISTRLTKIDGKYLALMRIVAADTDKVIATASVQTDTFATLLGEVTKQAERMMGDGTAWRASAP